MGKRSAVLKLGTVALVLMMALLVLWQAHAYGAFSGSLDLREYDTSGATQEQLENRDKFGDVEFIERKAGEPLLLSKKLAVTLNMDCREHDGQEYCGLKGDLVSKNFLVHLSYERALSATLTSVFMSMLENAQMLDASEVAGGGATFLDLGGNIGDSVVLLIRAMGDCQLHPHVQAMRKAVVSVEGAPVTAAINAKNLASANGHSGCSSNTRAITVCAALTTERAVRESQGVFRFNYNAASGNTGNLRINGGPARGNAQTAARTLEAVTEALGVLGRTVLMMKIDIELSEHRAILGAGRLFDDYPPCFVVLECSGNANTVAAVLTLAERAGYDAVWNAHKWMSRGYRDTKTQQLLSKGFSLRGNLLQMASALGKSQQNWMLGYADVERRSRCVLNRLRGFSDNTQGLQNRQ